VKERSDVFKCAIAFVAGVVVTVNVAVRLAPEELSNALGWKIGELLQKIENKALGKGNAK
jgi:hypothetical protein